MIADEDIQAVKIEAITTKDSNGNVIRVDVDDILIQKSDSKIYIQAKKNAPKQRAWSLTDQNFIKEVRRAFSQLDNDATSEVMFYSKTPFGDFEELLERVCAHRDYSSFSFAASQSSQEKFNRIRKIVDSDPETIFESLKHIKIGPKDDLDSWRQRSTDKLLGIVTHAETAYCIVKDLVDSNAINEGEMPLTKGDVIASLKDSGSLLAPPFNLNNVDKEFFRSSRMGRSWIRDIAGSRIPRASLSECMQNIHDGGTPIILFGEAGCGKTCVMLDIADTLEDSSDEYSVLFFKGDTLSKVQHLNDLISYGYPDHLIEKCGRLAESKRVVVLIDGLDTLSLSRDFQSLDAFLSLLDQLGDIKGVTIVVSCRKFDLEFDPKLRTRQWHKKVKIPLLDFDADVMPLLNQWSIPTDQLSEQTKLILVSPIHLRLFKHLLDLGIDVNEPVSIPQLYQKYFDELVGRTGINSSDIWDYLDALAARLVSEREQFASISFQTDTTIPKALVSAGVLQQIEHGRLGFTHQTLRDYVVVRKAVDERSLAEFINSFPPLPFARSFVRQFVFHLHEASPKRYHREIRQAWKDSSIAYHFRHLLIETFAEIVPDVDKDWPLVKSLADLGEPDLFQRFFWKTSHAAWFDLFRLKLLPYLRKTDGVSRIERILNKISIWLTDHPQEVVNIWLQAFDERWIDEQKIYSNIVHELDHRLQDWTGGTLFLLIEQLIKHEPEQEAYRHSLGHVISRYVDATGEGEDILWQYITRDVSEEALHRYDLSSQLHCGPSDLHKEDFLQQLLIRSESFLNLAISSLEKWIDQSFAPSEEHPIVAMLLHESSWELVHSQRDNHHIESLNVLLNGIEAAICNHAAENSEWWKTNIGRLLSHREETFRYLFLEAVQKNIEANISSIKSILLDKTLFERSSFTYELGTFMNQCYPWASSDAQEKNQQMILSMYDSDNKPWITNKKIALLSWIPAYLRTPKSHHFLDMNSGLFISHYRPSPHIHSSGGWVRDPVDTGELGLLSKEALVRLCFYFDGIGDVHDIVGSSFVGGRDQFGRGIHECASRNPIKYLDAIPYLQQQGVSQDYICHILHGVSYHLRFRFGNLNSSDEWVPVKPVPDGKKLAKKLLGFLNGNPSLWSDGYMLSEALGACAHVVADKKSIDILSFLLIVTALNPDPEIDKQVLFHEGKTEADENDLAQRAINTVRGKSAEAAMTMANRLLENDQQLPEVLISIIKRLASDPVLAVRVSVLNQLPFLTQKQPALGWSLFHRIMENASAHLWVHAERFLYYQYHHNYSDVSLALDSMREFSSEKVSESWGRITALCSLSGLMAIDDLLETALQMPPQVWKGIGQVFASNIKDSKCRKICLDGLNRLLHLPESTVAESLFGSIDNDLFGNNQNWPYIGSELSTLYLSQASSNFHRRDLFHFLDWFEYLAAQDPENGLIVAEELAVRLEASGSPAHIWHSDPLIAGMKRLLSYADSTDDPDIIRSVIAVYDKLLRFGIHNIDKLFES